MGLLLSGIAAALTLVFGTASRAAAIVAEVVSATVLAEAWKWFIAIFRLGIAAALFGYMCLYLAEACVKYVLAQAAASNASGIYTGQENQIVTQGLNAIIPGLGTFFLQLLQYAGWLLAVDVWVPCLLGLAPAKMILSRLRMPLLS